MESMEHVSLSYMVMMVVVNGDDAPELHMQCPGILNVERM
jgi:hypothetical protein